MNDGHFSIELNDITLHFDNVGKIEAGNLKWVVYDRERRPVCIVEFPQRTSEAISYQFKKASAAFTDLTPEVQEEFNRARKA